MAKKRLNAFPEKLTIVNADELHISDSATNKDRKILYSTLKEKMTAGSQFINNTTAEDIELTDKMASPLKPIVPGVSGLKVMTSAGETWIVPEGVHIMVPDATFSLEIFVSSAWRPTLTFGGGQQHTITIIADGINVRLENVFAVTNTIRYLTL